MAEITIKMASQLIGYTNADVTIPVADDITPEQVARLHWEWNLRFLQEQEKISNEPVTEEQEAAATKAAEKIVDAELPATVVDEVGNGSSVHSYEDGADFAPAPWDNPPAPEKKPWENKPSFDLF